MGEALELQTRRLPAGDDDSQWLEMHRARSMAERLERAFDAARFASELHGGAAEPR